MRVGKAQARAVQTRVDPEIYDKISEEAKDFSSMADYLRFIIYEHLINEGCSLPRKIELRYKLMQEMVKESRERREKEQSNQNSYSSTSRMLTSSRLMPSS